MQNYGYFMTELVITEIGAIFCIGYASFKLWKFIKEQGLQFNVAQLCLSLEIVAGLGMISNTI
jgi:hypothetical protein